MGFEAATLMSALVDPAIEQLNDCESILTNYY